MTVPAQIRVIGIGMGPQHVTPEAAEALRGCDYVIAAQKSADDELLRVRHAIAAAHGVPLVTVDDPERDRADPADYAAAVRDWHRARIDAYADVLKERGGTAGFLVWGDPSLYDSTIRIVSEITSDFSVVPGISAPQLLAARHRIVLHDVGQPLQVTTARRLRADIDAGQRNLVVMLSRTLDLVGLDEWSIWWGANLGAPGEQLIAGRVADVASEIEPTRERAKEIDGWVMDICLLRGPEVSR
jgi:precorrin-6A synthase